MRKYTKKEYLDNEVTRRIFEKYGSLKAYTRLSGISSETVRQCIFLGNRVPNGLTTLAIAKSLDLPFDVVADCVGFEKNQLVREIYKRGFTINDFAYEVKLRAETVYGVCFNERSRHLSKTIVRIAKGLGLQYDDVIKMMSSQ